MKTNMNKCYADFNDCIDIGKRWTEKGDRLYLSEKFKREALGLEDGAIQDGEKISNYKFKRIIDGVRDAWIDLENGELIGANGEGVAERIAAALNEIVAENEYQIYDEEHAEILLETPHTKLYRCSNGTFYTRYQDTCGGWHTQMTHFNGCNHLSDESINTVRTRYDNINDRVLDPREGFVIPTMVTFEWDFYREDCKQIREFVLAFYADVFASAIDRDHAEGIDNIEYYHSIQRKTFQSNQYYESESGDIIRVVSTHSCSDEYLDKYDAYKNSSKDYRTLVYYENWLSSFINFDQSSFARLEDGVEVMKDLKGRIFRADRRINEEEITRRVESKKN